MKKSGQTERWQAQTPNQSCDYYVSLSAGGLDKKSTSKNQAYFS